MLNIQENPDFGKNKENTTYYSYYWKPYKKIWNIFYEFLDWENVTSQIKNDMLWDLIEINESVYNNLINENKDKFFKKQEIKNEINFYLYPEKIEEKFLLLIQKFENKEKILKALQFVKNKHEWQFRDENTPYWTHLVLTAIYVINNNWTSDEVLLALLHDVIEDQFKPGLYEEIESIFWKTILEWSILLSKIRNWIKIDNKEYYLEISKNISLLKVKWCDRLSNLYWTYFWPDIEWNLDYLYKTKKEIIPLIEREFPDLASQMYDIIDYLKENTVISDEIKSRINDLKKIIDIKDSLCLWK